MDDEPFVHESSYVDDGAEIGAGTKIWHFSHVMPGARIGRRCNLGQNVLVAGGYLVQDNEHRRSTDKRLGTSIQLVGSCSPLHDPAAGFTEGFEHIPKIIILEQAGDVIQYNRQVWIIVQSGVDIQGRLLSTQLMV